MYELKNSSMHGRKKQGKEQPPIHKEKKDIRTQLLLLVMATLG